MSYGYAKDAAALAAEVWTRSQFPCEKCDGTLRYTGDSLFVCDKCGAVEVALADDG